MRFGGDMQKKGHAFEGGPTLKNKGKGGQVKYLRKTLKWHDV